MTSERKKSAKAFAPASVANVSCGFDVLAFAIYGSGDIVEVSLMDEPGVKITSIEGDGGLLPKEPPIDNTAGRAAIAML
jgi:homoserine kinase